MPKDAVERLQKLHRELKSVISIYDAANSSRSPPNPGETDLERQDDRKSPSSGTKEENPTGYPLMFDGMRGKSVNLNESDYRYDHHQMTSRIHKWSQAKPGSAPSYTSTSTDNYESDSIPESSPNANACQKPETEKVDVWTTDEKGGRRLDTLIWHEGKRPKGRGSNKRCNENEDPSDNSFSEAASFLGFDETSDPSGNSESDNRRNFHFRRQGWDLQPCVPNSTHQFRKPFRTRSESPRKEPPQELVKRPVTSTKVSETDRQKIVFKVLQPRHEQTNKLPKFEKRSSPHPPSQKNASRTPSSNREKYNQKRSKERERETDLATSTRTDGMASEEGKFSEKPSKTKNKGLQDTQPEQTNPCQLGKRSPKKAKSEGLETSQIQLDQLSKIIEKSNEKLEKMKVSKNLAIDIAKQLKNKYDEIKTSKNMLIDRLQKVEKDNERLNSEVKKEKDSIIKLQQSVQHLKVESKTIMFEQEVKTRQVLDENVSLKAKIKQMEMADRQKEIECSFKKRFSEKETPINSPCQHKCTSSLHKYRDDSQGELTSSPDTSSNVKRGRRCAMHGEDVKRLTNENSQLLLKVEELGILLRDRQSRINSLEKKMRDLEDEFKKQKLHLKQKTDRLEDTNKELESIRQNSRDLEDQVKSLRQSIENFDQVHQNVIGQSAQYENQIKKLQQQISQLETDRDRLKTELDNEKDSLLIKNKIIEDQQQTIKQLREKSEDIKTLVKKNQSLERLITIERDEKMELQDAVERLKWRKEELKRKIKSLEGDLLLAPQEVVRDLQKTQIVLHELENQVQIKQKEWEIHLQSLIREKEQACSVAEFATKALMQTTSEFQKQSEAHKRLHKVLAENLAEKEQYLREVNEKVGQNQLRDMLAEAEAETKRLVRLTALPGDKEDIEGDPRVWPQVRMEAMRFGDGGEERRKFFL